MADIKWPTESTLVINVEQGRRPFTVPPHFEHLVSVLVIRGVGADASVVFDSEGRLFKLLSSLPLLSHLTFRDVALVKSSSAPELA